MEEDYQIKGLFMQPSLFGGLKCLFDGDFSFNDSTKKIEGKMSDPLGDSKFLGKLNMFCGEMEFDKNYIGKGDRINYVFKRRDNSLWAGEFYLQNRLGGEAFCEIYKDSPSLDWEEILGCSDFSLGFIERYAESLTERLIGKGWIKETIDPMTGERYVQGNRGE